MLLYELAGADPALRFSPHCWKTRLALAHKGLSAERRPWRFAEKAAIAFSGQDLVPVLVDGDKVVADSWAIAAHLESAYPDRPPLFGSAAAEPVTRFVNAWADRALAPLIARLIIGDIYALLDPGDREYFRTTRERTLGATFEDIMARRDPAAFRAALAPLRRVLETQPFIGGEAMGYADYCVFGMFMWARCVSDYPLLAPDDPVAAWRERLLDAFGGLARAAPRAAA
jgi:glutathione S-transferase